jgi:hypothetical protein
MLLDAFKKKAILKTEWKELTLPDKKRGDLKIKVAADALRTPVEDQKAVRLGVSYLDTIQICRGMECVVPNVAIFDLMWKKADFPLNMVNMEISATVERSIQFSAKIDELLDGKNDPKDLVFGAWKLWILDKNIANSKVKPRGCVNRGFWDAKKKKWTNETGIAHPNDHADYSQVLQPDQRMAKDKDKNDVDLLDVFADEGVPREYLDVFDPAKDKDKKGKK